MCGQARLGRILGSTFRYPWGAGTDGTDTQKSGDFDAFVVDARDG